MAIKAVNFSGQPPARQGNQVGGVHPPKTSETANAAKARKAAGEVGAGKGDPTDKVSLSQYADQASALGAPGQQTKQAPPPVYGKKIYGQKPALRPVNNPSNAPGGVTPAGENPKAKGPGGVSAPSESLKGAPPGGSPNTAPGGITPGATIQFSEDSSVGFGAKG